ncbi:hypothetical protein MBH78_03675 [Oceanimonas sp. NS1]|nr:hypothetical protein [Oceanimonas sp. NS1]
MSQYATLSRLRRIALPLLLLTGTLLVTAGLFFHAQNQGLAHIRQNAEASLSRYIINLRHQLARHRDLPRLLATQQQLKALLADPQPAKGRRRQPLSGLGQPHHGRHRQLPYRQQRHHPGGQQLGSAQSLYRQRLQLSPLFSAGRGRRPGPLLRPRQYFASAGYFFSAPVRQNGQIIGVAVVKVDLEDIEGSWNDALQDILVMDEDGVIFISTRHHWRFDCCLRAMPWCRTSNCWPVFRAAAVTKTPRSPLCRCTTGRSPPEAISC